MELMRSSGVKIQYFHKPKMLIDHIILSKGFNRDHRKILILDGQTAYLGGRNIQDEYFLQWRDADIRITGPVVKDIVSVFEENQQRVAPEWGTAHVAKDLDHAALMDNIPEMKQYSDVTVQVVPESPTDKILPIRNCFEWAIEHAQRYFWFYNPYTPPPASTLRALKDAAARGVDVRWIAPANNDVSIEKGMGESLYKELLEAGVRIYEWQGEVLHAKQFMSDDYLLIIGSSNLDNLSFFLNYEVVTLVYNRDVTRDAATLYLKDLWENCVEMTLEEVQKWKAFRKLRNWIIRTFGGPIG
jgi:cardiolipin synthase